MVHASQKLHDFTVVMCLAGHFLHMNDYDKSIDSIGRLMMTAWSPISLVVWTYSGSDCSWLWEPYSACYLLPESQSQYLIIWSLCLIIRSYITDRAGHQCFWHACSFIAYKVSIYSPHTKLPFVKHQKLDPCTKPTMRVYLSRAKYLSIHRLQNFLSLWSTRNGIPTPNLLVIMVLLSPSLNDHCNFINFSKLAWWHQ